MAALLQYFSADANALDFAGGADQLEAARTFINKYVSDHTNKMIPELLDKGVLDPLTRLVLINTVYFKGARFVVLLYTFSHLIYYMSLFELSTTRLLLFIRCFSIAQT